MGYLSRGYPSLPLSLPLPSIASTYCILKDFKNRPYRILDTRRFIVPRWRLVLPPRASTFPLCCPVNIVECSPSASPNSPLLISFLLLSRINTDKHFPSFAFQRRNKISEQSVNKLQQITLYS